MKIKFKKIRFIKNIGMGSSFMLIGLSLFDEGNVRWSPYFIFGAGIMYLGIAIFEMINQYLLIENGILKNNSILRFGKKINLKEVYWIKELDGSYYLKTDKTVFKINIDLITKESLDDLIQLLSALDLPIDKTPFPSAPFGIATHTTETA